MDRVPLPNLSILLAEDNLVNQLLIEEMLKDWDVNLKIASDGREAIKLAKEHEFDLILMDLQMPNVDGFEAARFIKDQSHGPNNTHTPIYALTSDFFKETEKEAIASGMTGFLKKPLEIKELYSVLSRHSLV